MSLILCLSPAYQPLLCGLVGRDVCVISSTHYNMSNIIYIFMQERSLYISSLKMNGSELLFVYNNVEMVAAFVVYLFT